MSEKTGSLFEASSAPAAGSARRASGTKRPCRLPVPSRSREAMDEVFRARPFRRMQFTLNHEHPWDVSTDDAKRIQKRLAPEVRTEPLPQEPETVAGVDVSIRGDLAQAAIAVLRLPGLEVIDEAIHRCDVPFPYVPGLLSFREMPALLPALRKLETAPDLFMLDSQGLAHPRRFGLACHFGVVTGQRALGVAKSRLTGRRASALSTEKGSRVPLLDEDDAGETIGAVVRTRTDVKPVYVSVGHRITLEEAVDITLRCSPRYKIPEPTRAAHTLSRREEGGAGMEEREGTTG